jgi:polyisoprenoid-binding protein YceI
MIQALSMRYWICILFSLFSLTLANAQQQFVLVAKESSMIFRGTSSLHSWQCRVEKLTGKLTAAIDNQSVTSISALTLTFPALSIKSIDEDGKHYDKNMDKNMYRALNADKYPSITFSLIKFVKKNSSTKGLIVEAFGVLQVNGVSQEVTLSGICTVTPKGLIIEGELPLKMRAYNVEPPTAIFGTIKTGNEITINYKMAYRLLPDK